jgi:glycosyltransferase involved in cell wall biosynthesis
LSGNYKIGIHRIPAEPLIRGLGNVWPISGWIDGDLDQIESVRIDINGAESNLLEVFRIQNKMEDIDFFGVPLLPNYFHFVHFINSNDFNENTLDISIQIKDRSGRQQFNFATLQVIDHIPINPDNFNSAKVAICMTTYNPKIALFKKQIESIVNQSETSWYLIINDDCSDPDIFEAINDIVSHDDRITVFQNESNLGFYHNFERCLNRIHLQFEYVALADQDDFWYPTKLASLIQNLHSNVLIYNDMKIQSETGEIFSNTFWNNRSNHYKSLSTLFLANTVTGSAALFKSRLLLKLLPFPERLGNAFHDHWMALTAAVEDGLAYLDQVNQNYIQHNTNVTGYGQFNQIDLRQSTMSLLSLQRMKASVAIDGSSEKNQLFIRNNIKVYFDAYLRRKLQYEILLVRHPLGSRKRLDRIFKTKKKAIKELLTLHWKIYQNKWMTNNAELSYINAIEVMKQISVNFNKDLE